jgi:hypothetical protein
MDLVPNEKWTVVQLKAYLKSKNLTTTGNKPSLLRLACHYAVDFEDVNPNPEALSSSEEHLIDSVPNEKWTVVQLKAYLKSKNLTTSGNKPALLRLACHYAVDFEDVNPNPEALSSSEEHLIEKRKVFDDVRVSWVNITKKKATVPIGFSVDVINEYLTSTLYRYGQFEEEETISSGTEKPAKKGRHMYSSYKIQLCESGTFNSLVMFRCTMEASLKRNEFRYVHTL